MLKIFWAWIPAAVAFLLYMIIGCIPGIILSWFGAYQLSARWVFANGFIFYDFIAWLLGVRVHVTGDVEALRKMQYEGKGLCFMANHTSLFDIPLVIGAGRLRMGFVAKKEVAWIPAVNVLAVSFHSVFINRKNLKKGVESIRRGANKIRKIGCSLLIFPEGTRSKTGEIGPFKHGSFRLATESGAPIVPIALKGDRDLIETRKSFNPFIKTDVWINYMSPVETAGLDRDGIAELEKQVENSIRQAYDKLGK